MPCPLSPNRLWFATPLAAILLASGCGGSHKTPTPSTNPSPTVSSLSPTKLLIASSPQNLTINGTNFISSSTVTYNGKSHAATFVSGTQLTLSLASTDLSAAGTFPLVVSNPSPGGGASAPVNFEVDNPAPVVTALSPATIEVNSAATTLTITGTGFVSGSTVTFNSSAVTPSVVSSTQMTIPLTVADLAAIGKPAVVVSNPGPGGGTSAAVALAVTGPVLSGVLSRGLGTTGATINAYAINADGSSDTATPLGTTTQNSDGTFALALSALPAAAVRLTATGGTYTSPVDGKTVITATSSLSLVLDGVTADVKGLVISPISDLVSSVYAGKLSGKPVAAYLGAKKKSYRTAAVPVPATAHSEAAALILAFYGFSSKDVPEALPVSFAAADVTANPEWFKAGMVLGGLIQEALTSTPSSPDDIFAALSADIEDGLFDGLSIDATAVTFATGTKATLPFTAGTSDFLLSLGTFATSSTYLAGISVTSAELASLESGIFAGVYASPATPSSAGLLAGNSGALSSYTVGGKQYLIMAARSEGVVVIDISDPTAPSPTVKAWTGIPAAAFNGADVGGVITYAGLGGHPEVLAFAYGSTTVAFLNLSTLISGNPATDNPIDSTVALPIKATSSVSFSGGAAFIAGGIAGGSLVYLDTADGYYAFDLTTNTLGALYPVEDTNEIIAENMGGDIRNGILLGGNYGGLQYVDLTKQKSYYADRSTIASLFPDFDSELIDGNSVDSSYHVGILTSEDRSYAGFVNLAAVTETDSTGTGVLNALGIPAGASVELQIGSPTLSGSAVDSTTHLALFMAGYSDDIAVGQLQDPASVVSPATWQGLSDWRYFTLNNSPELASYGYATDPHSVGVVYNNLTKKPYGYLLDGGNGYRGVVQVDLAGFLALPDANDGSPYAHIIKSGTDPAATGGPVREISWP